MNQFSKHNYFSHQNILFICHGFLTEKKLFIVPTYLSLYTLNIHFSIFLQNAVKLYIVCFERTFVVLSIKIIKQNLFFLLVLSSKVKEFEMAKYGINFDEGAFMLSKNSKKGNLGIHFGLFAYKDNTIFHSSRSYHDLKNTLG